MYDVIIIGAGIIGSFIAHELSKYDISVAVLEKANDCANVTSMANSAIVHAGYDPKDGTLKAKLNVQGAKMYEAICRDLHVPYKKCGAYIAASGEQEEAILRTLYERGSKRGVRLQLMSGDEARAHETMLSDRVTLVMDAVDTAIINPWNLSIALMEEAMENGVSLYLRHEVTSIMKMDDVFSLEAGGKTFCSSMVINAAGVYADHIATMIEEVPPFHITAKKGQYYVLSKDAGKLVSRVIYPVPGDLGKGVLAVPTVDGNLLIGPNSEVCDEKDVRTSETGLSYLREHIARTMKPLPMQEVIRSFSGLRPSGNDGDFFIQEGSVKNMIHVGCIDSPGIASAPGIADYCVHNLVEKRMHLPLKKEYHKRRAGIMMQELTLEERNEKIKKDARYGNIVCRCEKISEGEIVDCIHRCNGARSIKGVKKRVRPGMGRCQGGFCEPAIREILARELHIDPSEVAYDEPSDTALITHPKGVF